MNPKPWTLLDTQVSKPSSAVLPSFSLLDQSWFSFKPHHLKDASLLSLPPPALPSCGRIWVGFCFWVYLILVAEMVAFHNLLPPANLTTSPAQGQCSRDIWCLKKWEPGWIWDHWSRSPHLTFLELCIYVSPPAWWVCWGPRLMFHLPVVMGPSGRPFMGASTSISYIKSNYFPGLAPLAEPLCSVFVHQVY